MGLVPENTHIGLHLLGALGDPLAVLMILAKAGFRMNAVKIEGSVALVTGADRGLGRAFARELVSRDAAKVYGAARHPAAVTDPGVTPIALDITDPERVTRVAHECADVTMLVNNAARRA